MCHKRYILAKYVSKAYLVNDLSLESSADTLFESPQHFPLPFYALGLIHYLKYYKSSTQLYCK